MDRYYFDQRFCKEVDLHNLNAWQARVVLYNEIENLSENIKEIIVIHGYNHGNYLKKITREEFHNKKIKKIYIGLNPGRTSYIIN